MRIHTDIHTIETIADAMPGPDVYHRIVEHGSRSRNQAFEVNLWADPGHDIHGIPRRYSTGGPYGTTDGTHRACTWVEWGDFLCTLFTADPRMKTVYNGAEHFISETHRAALARDVGSPLQDDSHLAHAMKWERVLNTNIAEWASQRNLNNNRL